MKDFVTLFNDIFTGSSSSYRRRGGSKKRRKEATKLPLGLPTGIFHKKSSGEANTTKSVFLLMLVGFFGIIAGCLILFVDPYDLLFRFKITLSNQGEIFELWKNPPIELYLRVFIFNVTNHDAFLAGREKLKFEEVGPYVYREYMEHKNVTFNANGTMTSIPHHPLKWVPELSNGTEDDILILPNIALLSFTNIMIEQPYLTRMAVNLYIRQTNNHPLIPMTAKEFMFGYKSDLVTFGNKLLPTWITFDKVGLIDRMYDFNGDVSTFYTGDKAIEKAGLLASYNRSPKLPQWDLPCGMVNGASDGTKFASFIKPNDSLTFFRKSLCRAMPLQRKGNLTYRAGLKGYEYSFVENAMDNGVFNKDNKCFCRKGKCLPRGLLDVTECYYGFPIALSFPHFYNSDPRLTAGVEGCNPDPAKHETYFIIQPETGLPLEVAVRMQINLAFGDLSPMARVGRFKNMVLPLLWTEIRMVGLPSNLAILFNVYIKILPVVQEAAIYLLFAGGIAFLLVAIIKLMRPPSSSSEHLGNYTTNFSSQNNKEDSDTKTTKSPLFTSKDVISEIIDEGRQAIFGKKKPVQKPNSNYVYRDTTRRKSSIVEMLTFLKQKKTKAEVYERKKSKVDSTQIKLLKSSTDSETDSEKKPFSPFYGEDNKDFSETDENITKLIKDKEESSSGDAKEDFDDFEVDVSMLHSLKEDIV